LPGELFILLSSFTKDLFARDLLTIECILTSQKSLQKMKALLDTGAIGYSFIDDRAARFLCEQLTICAIPLSRPRLLNAYNGRPVSPIIYAIYPTMIVQNLTERTMPILIIRLGNHPIILGKP